jgi:hypothetical protein
MGRTCPTYRMLLEQEIGSWKMFRDSLSDEDRRALDWIFDEARKHASACSAGCRLNPFESIAMCALVSLRARGSKADGEI